MTYKNIIVMIYVIYDTIRYDTVNLHALKS